MPRTATAEAPPAISPHLLDLRDLLRDEPAPLADFTVGDLIIRLHRTATSVFAIVRRKGSAGGLAVRAAYIPMSFDCAVLPPEKGEVAQLRLTSAMGEHVISYIADRLAVERLRITTCFTPARPMVLPPAPRDLYPLGASDDPLRAQGVVEASQRGLNTGLLYFRIEAPAFGNVLYIQNFTASNDYFRTTGTVPREAVAGNWPELGYALPLPDADADPAEVALPAGESVTLSDTILVFRHHAPPHERESARQFVQMLGSAYDLLDPPPVAYRDWIDRAERAARDLDEAPDATIRHYGHRYVHPYTGAEYPDIMVQMSVIAALRRWGDWRGEPHPLEAAFKAGLPRFFDEKLGTFRRYLPNVGKDKNADAVDSWYLYHPLLNLGTLALGGDDDARALFLKAIDYGVRVARHFDYRWPIEYDVTDFSVITKEAPVDGRGQTDVGGIYAWVMLQAFELTDDKTYLDEARAAIDAAIGLGFNLNYQANLTAWGAAACMRLWRITNRDAYREQSYVYLASFLHNAVIWDSRIGHAAHYETFLAVTCLQDAPYMAMYECFDSYVAFERYLDDGGPDLDPEARMLIGEYCRHALSRAWYYYPDALPPEAIAAEQREANGHIDKTLSFPLEDLYPDGQPAGQVGQEVYGAGAAFIFATSAFHQVEGAPFRLYCDMLVRAVERVGDHALSIVLDGGETRTASLRLVRLKRRTLTDSRVTTASGETIAPDAVSTDRVDYCVPAQGRLILTWE
ncbi:hypothetical protein V3I01_06375 [Sphingomonas sp. gentR]|jgi:hypothetical protein|uniref:hypothetical protein n=1 Tax=unclassified Sphingomonas TaxID=196159 RepID=UPI000972A0CC|nr:hypothetical protein [Sphingomonas sp. LK11]APX66015.1 hypothetical protein AV944_09385 [Sphingomonas sp. LK11]